MAAHADDPTTGIALHGDEGEARWFLDMLQVWKCSAETTDGRMTIIDHRAPHESATPLHVHHRDDEWFYIFEGEVTIWIGGTTTIAGPGDFVYAPKDVAHTNIVTSPDGAHFLVGFTPGSPEGADGFVRAASHPAPSLDMPPADAEAPDPDALTALAAEFGIEILGPPGIPA